MERKLELKDIAGYLPHGLNVAIYRYSTIIAECIGVIEHYLRAENKYYDEVFREESEEMKPILRPSSDLYRPVMHNGKEITPILELAKIHFSKCEWELIIYKDKTFAVSGNCYFTYNSKWEAFTEYINDMSETWDRYPLSVKNQYQLFDYLHELKIDYRGLIDAGLAVDCNTLENNPYK